MGDIWGHTPCLKLAVSETGRVLPLLWQWPLAGQLMRGQLSVFGPRPLTMGRVDAPRTAADVLAFWRSEPRAPGLVGRWAVAGRQGLSAAAKVLVQLWVDPGGFGTIGTNNGSVADASEVGAGTVDKIAE